MTKHTIELAGDFTVSKGPRDKAWLAVCTVDLAALPESIVRDLALHGLKQKIADAASGATNETDASAAMDKAALAILAGEWSTRGEGSAVDEFTREARKLVRTIYKAKVGAKSSEWATFTGLGDGDAATFLDALYVKNEKALAPKVEAAVEATKAEREARKAATVEFSI